MATAEIWRCLMENDNNTAAVAAAAASTGVGSTSTTLSSSVGESNGGAVSLRRRRMEIRRIKMLSSHVGASSSSSSFVEQPVSKRLRPVTLREDGMEDEKLLNRGTDNACSVECLGQGSYTSTATTITTASAPKQSRLLLSVFCKDDDHDIVVGERAASPSLSSACERVPSGGVCRLGEENECKNNASDIVGNDRMSSGGSTQNNIMLEDSDASSTLTSVGGFQSTLGNENIVQMTQESLQAPGEEPRRQEEAPTAVAITPTGPESSGGPTGMSTSTIDTVTIGHAENQQHLEAMVTGAGAQASSSLWQQRPVNNDGIPDSSAVATGEAGGSGVPANCFASNDCPPHGMVSVCGRRREMEDAVVSQDSFVSLPCSKVGGCDAAGLEIAPLHYFGVYDGHGGSQAANFCAQRLHHALAEEVESCFVQGQNVVQNADWESKWLTTMTQCFKRMDAEVGGFCLEEGECTASDNPRCCPEPIAPETVGTTAIVAVVGACQIIVGNCGDSRAVLSRGGVAIPLSVDHKPEREDEMARVEAAGGRVIYWNGYRVLGVLAMSRAIGDRYLKPYVIAEPEVKCIKRAADDECLVLASDGLWDVMSSEAVCDVARRALSCRRNGQPLPDGPPGATSDEDSPADAAAALLVRLALAKGSGDNISVVVVDLKAARSHR